MTRVCPERDVRCPHGMECPYADSRHSCKEGWQTLPGKAAPVKALSALEALQSGSAGEVEPVRSFAETFSAEQVVMETYFPSATPAKAVGGWKLMGYARSVDVDPADRPFVGRNSFWCSERQNSYYSVPVYIASPSPDGERQPEGGE